MAKAVAVATGTTDVQAVAGAAHLVGYSARESAGTPAVATFILRDGTDATGKLLVPVELAANESVFSGIFSEPIEVQNGVFLDRVAGETEVTVFVK